MFICQCQEGPSDLKDLWQFHKEHKGILFKFIISNHDSSNLNFLSMCLCIWILQVYTFLFVFLNYKLKPLQLNIWLYLVGVFGYLV